MIKELLQHPAMAKYVEKIRVRNFEVLASALDGVRSKDLRLITETAAEFPVPLPLASVVRDKIIAAKLTVPVSAIGPRSPK